MSQIEFPSEIKTQEEGFKALHALVDHAKTTAALDEKHEGQFRDIDKAVDDLRLAIAATNTRMAPTLSGRDAEIPARYVRADFPADMIRGSGGSLIGDGSVLLKGYETKGGLFVAGVLDDEPVTDTQAALQDWVEKRSIIRALQRGVAPHRAPRTPRCDEMIARLGAAMPGVVGKAFADAAGIGAEWIPDDTFATIERDIQYERNVAALFPSVSVIRETTKLPYLSGGFIPYIAGEIAGDDPAQYKLSSMVTADRTVSVKTIAARTQISENAEEDALLSVMATIIRPEGVSALVAAEEDAIINSDTAASHMDTGLATWNPDSYYSAAPGGSSVDHRRAWLGLRARAFDVSNTDDRSTFSYTTFAGDSASIKGPKNGPRDKVVIASGKVIAKQFMPLTELATVDKYGAAATIVTGEVGRIAGIPVIESQFMTDDLNASGIFDGSTMTTGGYVTCTRSRHRRYVRKGISIEVAKDITRGYFEMVWKRRMLFKTVDGSTVKNVHFAYNMS